jgi:hypothetical protein
LALQILKLFVSYEIPKLLKEALGKFFIHMVLLLAPRLILQPLDPQYIDGIHSHIRRQVCGLTSIEIIAATAFNHPFPSYLHLQKPNLDT